MNKYVYPKPRPNLTIESTGGSSLGNCYSSTSWKVTSSIELSDEKLAALNNLGVLGFGQEFYVRSHEVLDIPSNCVEVDSSGKVVNENPIHGQTGTPYGPCMYVYHVYNCESRVDSSD